MADQLPLARDPHYVRPTAASQKVESCTDDQDRVRNAFHPCSYTSISSLEVGRSRPGEYPGPTGLRCGKAPQFFSEYEYMSDPFSLADELQSEERKQLLKKMQAVGNTKPFGAPGTLYQARYETAFEYISEPFDSFKDDTLRRKWLDEQKALAGPFVPAGSKGTLERPTRAMLTEMLTHLYRILSEDWEEAQPTVFTTEEDLIVTYFNLQEIRNPDGIKAYMNVLADRNDALAVYDLRRVPEGWGMLTDDHHLMFALRPPWVKPKRFGSNAAATGGPPGSVSGATGNPSS
eukprot:GGOE01014265.1.p1 GENE.GGOE01014265.1~~GGOE01014265.1.p1  ORF type:complete len:318 (-),score=97.72 GGOE01014265.1:119-988(-)